MKSSFQLLFVVAFLSLAACGALIDLTGETGANATPANSSESNIEASVTSTIDEINSAASS
ncbi:MAG: hypothetical protein ACD_62C00133G0005, partial [uncultured bacterium]